jgi:multidrug transporter EmrE-like cation transporter
MELPVDGARSRVWKFAGACCAALFALAFVAALHSCEWGLSAYFWTGVATLPAMFALPFLLHAGASAGRRFGLAFLLAGLACATWIVGLFAANVRIMCRLF